MNQRVNCEYPERRKEKGILALSVVSHSIAITIEHADVETTNIFNALKTITRAQITIQNTKC